MNVLLHFDFKNNNVYVSSWFFWRILGEMNLFEIFNLFANFHETHFTLLTQIHYEITLHTIFFSNNLFYLYFLFWLICVIFCVSCVCPYLTHCVFVFCVPLSILCVGCAFGNLAFPFGNIAFPLLPLQNPRSMPCQVYLSLALLQPRIKGLNMVSVFFFTAASKGLKNRFHLWWINWWWK